MSSPDEIIQARLGREGAEWADTTVAVLQTPFPWASGHLSLSADDCDLTPDRLHPAFHASLDWHSSVHMQRSAMLLAAHPGLDQTRRESLVAELNQRLTRQHLAVEVNYLAQRRSFERPYGWGWAAALAATAHELAGGIPANTHELAGVQSPISSQAAGWAQALTPLADLVGQRLLEWLPTMSVPVRHGVHSNTAFALGLAHDAYTSLGATTVVEMINRTALGWFGNDVDYPSAWEPSGADFLSPALAEADLMRRVLDPVEFGAWLRTFLPVLGEPGDALLRLPEVRDDTDGHAVHLYGLGLSRAAMLRRLAPWLDDPARSAVLESAAEQYAWAAPQISRGDFMSTHWLVSFALL